MPDVTFGELMPFLMFAVLTPLLFSGLPVAFILGGVALLFWAVAVLFAGENPASFFLVVSRIFGGVVSKTVLVAIPMFVFMGTMLEKSGIARDLLATLQKMTHRVPGGLALSVTLLGVILAATTGIIGASVVMMTLMALPVMLEHRYDGTLATGTIAASGTLGILLPPSIMLVVMADLLGISTGALFMAAIVPGLMLAGLYMAYIAMRVSMAPHLAPQMSKSAADDQSLGTGDIFKSLAPPTILILVVLGSIFGGIATPTEASGVGAAGALILAAIRGKLTRATMQDVVETTALTSAMLFGLFVGATAFSYVFALLGGHDSLIAMIEASGVGSWGILAALMLTTFLLGFFFDWIEITLIILPVFAPVIAGLDFAGHVPAGAPTLVWFAVLMAVNLQTSFLTPPFGFALFYMKGAAPDGLSLSTIYKGIFPFVLLQLAGLVTLLIWPDLALWLTRDAG
ncbi:TRAP transporter large permease [Eilatimonas milleporae]|uniref:TRAP transporter large permease protein n=1 Tax=Eilatimonas milleporae TaxID=911205 RepID=A0A3M0CJD5_9PROT|nr:TRAP transporter large permease subunit [Eilatimonas milleporae]RMB08985.1 tripartite ATP-independent transporter DctM subunit [Eilatimonas milleporae]